MGVYIYAINKTGSRPIVVNGTKVTAAPVKYFCRASTLDSWGCSRYRPLLLARLTRMENAWGDNTPEYAVLENYEDGAPVFAWPKGRVHCDDFNWGGAKVVGKLQKQGRDWVVVPT